MRNWTSGLLAVFAVFAIALTGCGDDSSSDEEGSASGATCPTGSTLTYEAFGRAFMEHYCTRCHSSALSGAARNGAPSDHNFDTLAGIKGTAVEHIDEEAAAGPDRVNTAMPPNGPQPTEDERRLLGEWLACGTPP
jgi:uncharacterized membrane protein